MTAVVERLSSIEEVVKKVYKTVNEGNEVKDLGATPGKEGVEVSIFWLESSPRRFRLKIYCRRYISFMKI